MSIEMIERKPMGPEEFADAVDRAGGVLKTAALLGWSKDSIDRWKNPEGKGVPNGKVLVVREKMARFLHPAGEDEDATARMNELSDADILGEVALLLAEMARRLGSSVTYGRFSADRTKPAPDHYDVNNPARGTHYGNSGPPGRRTPREDPREDDPQE